MTQFVNFLFGNTEILATFNSDISIFGTSFMKKQWWIRVAIASALLLPIPGIVWIFSVIRTVQSQQKTIQSTVEKIAALTELQQQVYKLEEVISVNFLPNASDSSSENWRQLYAKTWQTTMRVEWSDKMIFDMRPSLPRVDNLYQRMYRKKFKIATFRQDSAKIENLAAEFIDEVHRAAESLGITAEKLRLQNAKTSSALALEWEKIIRILIATAILLVVIPVLFLIVWQTLRVAARKRRQTQTLEGHLNAFLETSNNGYCLLDTSYKIIHLNAQFHRLFFYRYQIHLREGKNLISELSQDGKASWALMFTRVLKGERFSVEQNFPLQDKTGHLEIFLNPVLRNNVVTGISLALHETTKEKKNTESLDRRVLDLQESVDSQDKIIQSILNETTEGVALINDKGETLFANRLAQAVLHAAHENANLNLWSGIYGVYYCDTKKIVEASALPVERALRGETWEGEKLFVRVENFMDGIEILVSCRPLFEKNPARGSLLLFKPVPEKSSGLEVKEIIREIEIIREVPVEVVLEREVVREVPVEIIREIEVIKEVLKPVEVLKEIPVSAQDTRHKEKFEFALRHISDWIIVLSSEGIITHGNYSVEQMIGQSAGSLSGKSIFDLVHPDDHSKLALFQKDAVLGNGHSLEIRIAQNNNWIPLKAQLHKSVDEIVMIGKMSDAELQPRRQKPAGVSMTCSPFGVITSVEGSSSFFKLEPSALIGQSAFKFFEDKSNIRETIYRALDGIAFSIQYDREGMNYLLKGRPTYNNDQVVNGIQIDFESQA